MVPHDGPTSHCGLSGRPGSHSAGRCLDTVRQADAAHLRTSDRLHRSRTLGAMSSRRTDRLRPAGVLSHLGVMIAVAAVMGVLVAGLALPFAAVTGCRARTVADGMDKLPADADRRAARAAHPDPGRGRQPCWPRSTTRTASTSRSTKVAPIMRKAIIAIEDYRFYQHGALDLKGTLRAFVTNQANNGVVQGGSSITQQMVKHDPGQPGQDRRPSGRPPPRTPTQRKFKELRYAIAFEQKYSKDWILERYLNIAYFGDGAYGIEAAARHYFSEPRQPSSTSRQAALLAGLVKNPTGYDPTNYPDRAASAATSCSTGWPSSTSITRPRRAAPRPAAARPAVTRTSATAASPPRRRSSATTCSQYLLSRPDLGKTADDRSRLLVQRRPDHQDHASTRASSAPPTRPCAPTSDPTRPGDRRPGDGRAGHRRGPGARPVAADGRRREASGETYLNYVVPTAVRRRRRLPGRLDVQGVRARRRDQAGHPAVHHRSTRPQHGHIPQTTSETCDGHYAGTDIWQPSELHRRRAPSTSTPAPSSR